MRIVISTDSASPIYEQIRVQARSAILSGAVATGEALPSLRQLAADLRVSVITITRAYNALVAEGLVKNEHGRGFVVLPVDAATAESALTGLVDRALADLCAAARDARIPLDDLHDRLDRAWRDTE